MTTDRQPTAAAQPMRSEAARGIALLVVTTAIFVALYNRETALSYSIGYNLYGAERVLDGEVPYRDFHTLYTPAIVYLNAALFQWFGTTLVVALGGVLVFKILTTLALYGCARRLLPVNWALAAALYTLVWLRPNGGFKAVPMHYGALFLSLALLALLRAFAKRDNGKRLAWGVGRRAQGAGDDCDEVTKESDETRSGKTSPAKATGNLFFAGVALGLLTLFKHNIGAYALLGALAVLLFDGVNRTPPEQTEAPEQTETHGHAGTTTRREGAERARRFSPTGIRAVARSGVVLLAGFAVAVLPVLGYMLARGALAAMIDTLLFGPGEFLLSRLAAVPSPVAPLALALWLVGGGWLARRWQSNKQSNNWAAPGVVATMTLSVTAFALAAPQRLVDPVIFYAPVLILLAGVALALFADRFGLRLDFTFARRRALLAVTLFAGAAYMEAFPRFAREQAVAAMPFIALLLLLILYNLKPRLHMLAVTAPRYRLLVAALPLLIFLMGARLSQQTYFDGLWRFRSDTPLLSERGRGVYFPADKAREIDDTVAYLQQRIPAGGFFFPQSYAGSSYLFLADRNNPSGAQFWGGVGVSESARAATLEALRREDVQLIVTSRRDLEAEKYAPLREFIETRFSLTREFGDTVILERGSRESLGSRESGVWSLESAVLPKLFPATGFRLARVGKKKSAYACGLQTPDSRLSTSE